MGLLNYNPDEIEEVCEQQSGRDEYEQYWEYQYDEF